MKGHTWMGKKLERNLNKLLRFISPTEGYFLTDPHFAILYIYMYLTAYSFCQFCFNSFII